ncbi:MAG: A/G-specific adenine glycosylase [Flavobacteriales bacterium]|nr:A/G-specific adenine glycosylase [Flavobacteriales bacterium]
MDADHHPFPTNALRQWYGRAKRDLPWRGSSDPYTIWISEVILQQTRVDQGTPYYHRFLSAFPTVTDLANAHEDEVLKLWEGLGYYSRARNLHAAAKQVTTGPGGCFPNTYEGLRSLKGVGPYTAAAIGSIAFDLPVACVDGNVTRVLARFHGITDPVDSAPVIKAIDRSAQGALDIQSPGEHNQAMMELGATVCLPRNANCEQCPLQAGCNAYRLGLVDSIPMKSKRTKVRERYFHFLVLTDGEHTVVERRPAGDIWQGLYQFPMLESDRTLDADEVLAHYRIKGAVLADSHGPVRHILTHQRIFGRFFEFRVKHLPPSIADPVPWQDLERLAFPRLIHHYLNKKMLAHSKKV